LSRKKRWSNNHGAIAVPERVQTGVRPKEGDKATYYEETVLLRSVFEKWKRINRPPVEC
jgi:hypothetical protein